MIAACGIEYDHIVDKKTDMSPNHKALLRFRDSSVSTLTGIPFRKVKVQKAIYSNDTFYDKPTIKHQNLYSHKVTGGFAQRSIINTQPSTRFIAPKDFYERLFERHKDKIQLGKNVAFAAYSGGWLIDHKLPKISTVPMDSMCGMLGWAAPDAAYKAIWVQRYRAGDCDLFQTVYFPDGGTPIYRISISGNSIIVESVAEVTPVSVTELIYRVFGIPRSSLLSDGNTVQGYGKIAPIDESTRKALILEMTLKHNIYSLGRFAIWKNILLDEIPGDVEKIKRLITGGNYAKILNSGSL